MVGVICLIVWIVVGIIYAIIDVKLNFSIVVTHYVVRFWWLVYFIIMLFGGLL